jgi:hypothetical protein
MNLVPDLEFPASNQLPNFSASFLRMLEFVRNTLATPARDSGRDL